jgi:hypothetical protein
VNCYEANSQIRNGFRGNAPSCASVFAVLVLLSELIFTRSITGIGLNGIDLVHASSIMREGDFNCADDRDKFDRACFIFALHRDDRRGGAKMPTFTGAFRVSDYA